MKFKLTLEAIEDKRVVWHEIIESENITEVFARLLVSQSQMMQIIIERAEENSRQLVIDDDIPF